jgi:cytochrome P450
VELRGYTIPKGSTVLGSLFSAMRDPKHFPDPETFNPDRFINAGKVLPLRVQGDAGHPG